MSKITEIKGTKGTITLKQFISMGKTISDIYKDNEEEQAKAIGRYFDSVCRIERR